jgi:sterol 3beta-glucosyltransferase
MHVVMLTVGSRGDVQPFVAFGAGLRAAGHTVRICTHASFEALVAGQDLEFAPLAEGAVSLGAETPEGRRWAQSHSRWLPTWVGLIRDARSVAHRRLEDAVAGCDGADVIVASNLTQGLGWQLSRELRIPLVRALLNAPNYWMARRSWRPGAAAARQMAWLAARPWLNAVRRETLSWPPVPLREPIGALDRDGRLVLYPFSPSVFAKPAGWGECAQVTGYWFLDAHVDPDPPDALRDFLKAGPPPVCIGFGMQIDRNPTETSAVMVQALRRARQRGVLLRPPEALEGVPLGENIFALERVSHAWLFPRCSAVVHHGAAGTTATALRAGVPSVTVPHNADQFSWARRMHELGVSTPPIPRRRLSVQRLEEAISVAATDRALRGRAGALAQGIRGEDGVARAVAAFERRARTPATAPRRRRRRRGPQTLPNGLRVHGARPADAKSQHFIDSYFEGGLELRRGMTVFDVGANIGLFSLEVLRRTGGDLELFAFEPAPDSFGFLERNVRELFPDAPVRLARAAVAEQPGEATLYHRPRVPAMSSLYCQELGDTDALLRGMLRDPPDKYRDLWPAWFRRLPPPQASRILRALGRWSQAEIVEVACPVTTVSAVVREHDISHIDFLKIDVEGAELDVLRGIDAEDWTKIDRLAAEVHDIDGRLRAMRDLLGSAGFEALRVDQEWPFEGTNVFMLHAARPARVGDGAKALEGHA